jgi:hypothetical protein
MDGITTSLDIDVKRLEDRAPARFAAGLIRLLDGTRGQ